MSLADGRTGGAPPVLLLSGKAPQALDPVQSGDQWRGPVPQCRKEQDLAAMLVLVPSLVLGRLMQLPCAVLRARSS